MSAIPPPPPNQSPNPNPPADKSPPKADILDGILADFKEKYPNHDFSFLEKKEDQINAYRAVSKSKNKEIPPVPPITPPPSQPPEQPPAPTPQPPLNSNEPMPEFMKKYTGDEWRSEIIEKKLYAKLLPQGRWN